MANRLFNQFRLALEKQVVDLYAQMTATDGAGAISFSVPNSKGIASIAKVTGNGRYDITLQDSYVRLLNIQAMSTSSAGLRSWACLGVLSSSDVNSSKVISIQLLDFAGAIVNPNNGEVIQFQISLSNSTAN